MCRNLVTKKMHFLQEKKKPELKNSKCDLIEMMKVACKDECTIGSLAEFSWMWFSDEIAGTAGDDVVDADIDRAMKPRWHNARNLKDGYAPQNTSKTCTNVDNVMIKL